MSETKRPAVFMQNESYINDIDTRINHIETLNNCLFNYLQEIRKLDEVTQYFCQLESMENLSDLINEELTRAGSSLQDLTESLNK